MRIQHNVTALNAYRNLRGNNLNLAKNLEKLSSGYRINRAGDDAAGLAVSEKMRAQITGLDAATKNAQDGISLVQTAEGALTEVHSMLNRMVTLATQSANGTYDNEVDRANLQKEVASLKTEIDRISESSNYNGIKLLDGSLANGAMKSKLPDVTVNGLTGAGGTAADAVIEVKNAADYQFNGVFNTKAIKNANAGDTSKIEIRFKDSDGNNNKIEMTLVGDSTDGKTIDLSKSLVKFNDKDITNSAFKGITLEVTDNGNITTAISKVLSNINQFSDLFDVNSTKTVASATAAATADNTNTATHINIKAKTKGLAEVTSVLTNAATAASLVATHADHNTLKDVALTEFSKKVEDGIVIHGIKMASLANDKATPEDIKKATIEVNGEKFLFVNSTDKSAQDVIDAIAKAGIKAENIIYSATPGANKAQVAMDANDVKAMVKAINKSLGEEIAYIGDTATDIEFKGKENLGNGNGLTLQIGDTAEKFNKMSVSVNSMSTMGLGINTIDISTQDKAASSISKIKDAINSVSSTRGDLGALQNRLEHTINNLGVMHENITEAESRIRDTDMAKEMMAYAKNNILVQSSTAMLAQANQLPQSVLQLLQ